jgi:hypothetical protein
MMKFYETSVIEETENETYAKGIELASGDTVFIKKGAS